MGVVQMNTSETLYLD